MPDCVFVYGDGKVGLRSMREAAMTFREPIPQPFSMNRIDEADTRPMVFQTRDYARRGAMFDGRPIYCEAPYTVREAVATWISGERDSENAERSAREQLDYLVNRNHGFVVDETVEVLEPADPSRRLTPLKARRCMVGMRDDAR